MNEPATSPVVEAPSGAPRRWAVVAAGLLIVLAGAAAYSNSFGGVFMLDDEPSIHNNPTVHHLWPIWPVLFGATSGTVVSRPVLNLSLAVNYALGGTDIRGYHALNLAVHLLAGLALFGVVRRTLLLATVPEPFRRASTGLALAAALLWTLHPLQTESVTYIVQRAESICGLFYLLTLYGVIRGASSRRALPWYVAAVTACVLGTATKEVTATAPVIVLIYDRVFLAGSFREALRRRKGLFIALAATWVILAALVMTSGGRERTAGFGLGMGPWEYVRTQFGYIVLYLRLAVWPDPLTLDYGTHVADTAAEIVPYAIIVALLAAGSVAALRYRPWLGFLGAWFLLILAPTSSIVPLVTQVAAEHRLYLPLAGVVVLAVVAGYAGGRRLLGRLAPCDVRRRRIGLALALATVGAVATPFGLLTVRRNEDYHDLLGMWSTVVARHPENPRGHCNVGDALIRLGRTADALDHYREALRLKTKFAGARSNCGLALAALGRFNEAVEQYRLALQESPANPGILNNLGNALTALGRPAEAVGVFREALQKAPDSALLHFNLANTLADMGRTEEAVFHYREALRLDPAKTKARTNLGILLASMGRLDEAIREYRTALQTAPADTAALNNLGIAMATLGRSAEAVGAFREAIRVSPNNALFHFNLANSLTDAGRLADAVAEYREALRIEPRNHKVLCNLGIAVAGLGKLDEAVACFREALKVEPAYAMAHNSLGAALAQQGRLDEAAAECREAIRLNPRFARAHSNLGLALMAMGKPADAIASLSEAVRLDPAYPEARAGLASALTRQGRYREAADQYRAALRARPNFGPAAVALAWLLAACPDDAVRSGPEALQLATRIRQAAPSADPALLDLLAAAYAEAGRFDEAVATADRAARRADELGRTDQAREIRTRLKLYQDRRPYRQTETAPAAR